MVAVGIDLGTTYSCVAVWRHGTVEVIANEQGNRTTPSFVAFTPSERLIGEEARNQAAYNPRNTIFGAKRLIGRRYDDIGVQMDLRHWPFQISNQNGKPMIVVDYRGKKKTFAPEEISSMVLCRLKEIAENYLGTKVDKAVITVPAYFNDSQRHATRSAGAIAGLEVLRITNEPTAAALTFGLDTKGNRNILIYDLGGGTFDVSVLSINDSVYEVKSTAGNTRLGGEDFDNRLVAYFAEDFRKKYHTDISGNAKALRRLKTAAERTKRFLSSYTEATVEVDGLCDGIDYQGRISRALFEELCSDLFRDTLGPVEKALSDARLKKSDIHNIILVGGSTRIPKIQAMLKEIFAGRPLTTSLNPDEAVACGAAIQAAILNGQHHEKIKDLLLVDVVPLSLGIETARGMMYKVIERNTPLPCQKTKEITTLDDYQNSMTIEIFEGERSLTKDNNLLGVIELNGIPPAPRGIAKIDVTFSVDVNGILSVIARDRSTGNAESVTITNENRLNQQQIAKMVADASKYCEDDIESRRRLEARNQLESYVYEAKRNVSENLEKLTEKEREFMKGEFEAAIEWLDCNLDCLREEFERQMTELLRRWSGILRKIYRHQAKRQRSENYQSLEEHEPATIEEVHDENNDDLFEYIRQ
ncbi:heat shock protein 68-like [Trichoplusia ni]|uniref:Heat shock protein 68-like n=1 Tax=Trichoplusia ni TaxID=7111 RepID=A0A7E5X462_TRINI|nr:heat shock protein 68-like [Trichoplusia ni]